MKIFVSAAEISSDIHAEKIVSALIAAEGPHQVMGIGGPRLRSIPGFQCIEKAESLRAMGFVEVVGKLSHLRSVMAHELDAIRRFEPDLILTFDYPDFHLRLMKKLHTLKIAEKALKVCGIPPKVWVWRSHRVERIRRYYDGVWVIFPFEKKFYESKGIPVIYEGNPLAADLFQAQPRAFSLPSDGFALAVMPGSRDAELKLHLPIIPPTLHLFSARIGRKVHALVPVPSGLSFDRARESLISSEQVQYHFIENGTREVLENASLGLIKSGTSTLEAALLGCVPVIFYRVSRITEWIFRIIARYTGPVGLPNILLKIRDRKASVFPELLGPEATPERLADALHQLASNPDLLAQKRAQGLALKKMLVPHDGLSTSVATRIREWVQARPFKEPPRKKSLMLATASFLWSSVNWIRRCAYRTGLFRSVLPSVPSILVGNLQAGGTGKTPVVIAIAKAAVARGKRVAVISRGYGSQSERSTTIVPADESVADSVSASRVGDEPTEIKRNVPSIVLGVGADRLEVLKRLPPVDLIIFDDGFQNLKFRAHRTVLCLTDRSRSEAVYRDFISQKKYADVVLNRDEMEWAIDELPKTPIWLLCGVGDPDAVLRFYRNRGVEIRQLIAKPDHAAFDEAEVKKWLSAAEQAGCRLAVTEKDHVKLGDRFPTVVVLRRELRSIDWIPSLF